MFHQTNINLSIYIESSLNENAKQHKTTHVSEREGNQSWVKYLNLCVTIFIIIVYRVRWMMMNGSLWSDKSSLKMWLSPAQMNKIQCLGKKTTKKNSPYHSRKMDSRMYECNLCFLSITHVFLILKNNIWRYLSETGRKIVSRWKEKERILVGNWLFLNFFHTLIHF